MESRGLYFIGNKSIAPVLEISQFGQRDHGRVYWANDFSAPNGLQYDSVRFSRLVDKVWRWIRKHGVKTDQKYSPYYLPDAWRTRTTTT